MSGAREGRGDTTTEGLEEVGKGVLGILDEIFWDYRVICLSFRSWGGRGSVLRGAAFRYTLDTYWFLIRIQCNEHTNLRLSSIALFFGLRGMAFKVFQ